MRKKIDHYGNSNQADKAAREGEVDFAITEYWQNGKPSCNVICKSEEAKKLASEFGARTLENGGSLEGFSTVLSLQIPKEKLAASIRRMF